MKFWEQDKTTARVRAAYPPEVARALPSDKWDREPVPVAPLYRMAGSYLDYEKLLTNGIPGIKRMVAEYEAEARSQGRDAELFWGWVRMWILSCMRQRHICIRRVRG